MAITCPNCGAEVEARQLIPMGDKQACPACRDDLVQTIREGSPDRDEAGGRRPVLAFLLGIIFAGLGGLSLCLIGTSLVKSVFIYGSVNVDSGAFAFLAISGIFAGVMTLAGVMLIQMRRMALPLFGALAIVAIAEPFTTAMIFSRELEITGQFATGLATIVAATAYTIWLGSKGRLR